MMKRIMILPAAVLMATLVISCGNTRAEETVPQKARDFELKDINGEDIRLSDYSGKVILLNFFATWCPPCRREMPDFNLIQEGYADDVKIIAINVGREGLQRVKEFARTNGLKFTIAMDNGTVSRLYGPMPGIPVTVIIDRDFNIAERYIGLRTREVFVKDIERLLR